MIKMNGATAVVRALKRHGVKHVFGLPGTAIMDIYDAFEEMDLVSTFRPVTKWSFQVPNVNRVPEFVTLAYKKTLQGRPRPVFLAIPEDFQNRDIQFPEWIEGGELYRPAPSERALDKVIELLALAKAPIILAGGGARSASGEGLLARLAERLQSPVVTSWLRDDLMKAQHPLFVGTAGIGAFSATIQAIEEADLVLSLGCRFSEFTTNRYRLLRKGQRLVHVDIVAMPPLPADCTGVHPLEIIDVLNKMQTAEHLYVTDSGNPCGGRFGLWLSGSHRCPIGQA